MSIFIRLKLARSRESLARSVLRVHFSCDESVDFEHVPRIILVNPAVYAPWIPEVLLQRDLSAHIWLKLDVTVLKRLSLESEISRWSSHVEARGIMDLDFESCSDDRTPQSSI